MRGAQTIRRLACACSGLALLVACGPERKRLEPRKSALQGEQLLLAPPGSSSEAPTRASLAHSVVAETLRAVHEQKLEVVARTEVAARLAFGPGRLLQAAHDKLLLRDTKLGDVIAETPLEAVRAVAQSADGALFSLGALGGVRFAPHTNTRGNFPHVTFLPGTSLFPDLEDPNAFYVYAGEQAQLSRYSFELEAGAFLPLDAQITLTGCEGAIGQLRDGAFVCHTAFGLARHAPHGSHTEFKLPAGFAEPFRLLAAKRLDELFCVSRAGLVVHLRLAQGLAELARFQLPSPAYAAVSNVDSLAFVLVSSPQPNQARRWSLLVTDFTGQLRFQSELFAQGAPAGEDWSEAITADKNLAISAFEPLVAVGGASAVQVWDYSERREAFTR